MISIFAPAGIGEVGRGTELAAEIAAAVTTDPSGPLRAGDIVVVTSKIVSKAEGRTRPAAEREAAIDAESRGTVARRGPTRIVRTRHGLTVAAAGVDNSNVSSNSVLLLPVDPDASAERLRSELEALTGLRLGVVISDTAGRAWRIGQTDQAIGAAGVQVVERYAGRRDGYGNELQVTAIAIADELAGAADLVKTKLAGRPVAVVRGLERYVVEGRTGPFDRLRERTDELRERSDAHGERIDEPRERSDAHGERNDAHGERTVAHGERTDETGEAVETSASVLIREPALDMFRYGSREAVIAAVLQATGQAERFEEVLGSASDEALVADVVAGSGTTGDAADLLRRVLVAGLSPSSSPAAG